MGDYNMTSSDVRALTILAERIAEKHNASQYFNWYEGHTSSGRAFSIGIAKPSINGVVIKISKTKARYALDDISTRYVDFTPHKNNKSEIDKALDLLRFLQNMI